MVKVDRYRVVARFARLFPDPAVFEDQEHLVERYLVQNGLPPEKTIYLHQRQDEINPIDDSGKSAVRIRNFKFSFPGQEHIGRVHAQCQPGTGILRLRNRTLAGGSLWIMEETANRRNELPSRDFSHETQTLNITNVSELYEIMKKQGQATTFRALNLARCLRTHSE